jgi:UDP-2,3-diacylglucosamine pyrophosphatase LpxH
METIAGSDVLVEQNTYRSLFLSDLHLGLWSCNAAKCLALLEAVRADHVFLLGDIIESRTLERMSRSGRRPFAVGLWRKRDTEVVQALQHLIRCASSATYLPGNHDGNTFTLLSHIFPGLGMRVALEAQHTLADGRKALVFHGDRFDGDAETGLVIRALGALVYDVLVRADYAVNAVRRAIGWGPYRLAASLKIKLYVASEYIRQFELKAARLGRRRGADVVVCGHIHTPRLSCLEGVVYANSGDWLESCTALAETHEGELVLLDWRDAPDALPLRARALPGVALNEELLAS